MPLQHSPVRKSKFTLGTFHATQPMRDLVNKVLDSGRLSYGPLCSEFERRFAHMHERGFGVLSNSGTSSLQVSLQALKEAHGWADGDEVIIPALTFVATANVVYHCRLKPVLVDVDSYYCLNPTLLERAITQRSRCIIPVHAFGQGADMARISAIAGTHGLKIIEDSCEAMFVKTGGAYVGSWGDVGCFSTYVAHIITGGVGGVSITSNADLALHMRSLVNHGIDLTELPSGEAYDPSFLARNFSFSRVGHSFRITELEAALLLPQLDEAAKIIATRQHHAHLITDILSEHDGHIHLPQTRPGNGHSFMVYPIVLREDRKNPLMAFLRERGVECRDMLPLTTQPAYRFKPFLYPAADFINKHGFYIGCHQGLQTEDFEHLASVFEDWFKASANLNKDVIFTESMR